jgi:hypothetical protein
MNCLTAEAVKSAALTLEGVDDVEGSDGLALGVLGVGDSVADDTLEEGLENTAGLLVDHGGDTLDTTTARETADGGLGDTLDVVAQDLAVALGTTLSETLAALAAWRGCQYVDRVEVELRRVEDELSGVGTHVQSC